MVQREIVLFQFHTPLSFLGQYYSYLMESFPDSAERQHTRLAVWIRAECKKPRADITIKSTGAQVKQINFNYRKKNRAECNVENLYVSSMEGMWRCLLLVISAPVLSLLSLFLLFSLFLSAYCGCKSEQFYAIAAAHQMAASGPICDWLNLVI